MAEENEGTSRAPYAGDGEGLTKRQKRLLKMTNIEPMSRSRACRGRNSGRGRGKSILEWWSFELLVLLSRLLPNPKLETSILSICLNSISCLYNIPYGLSNTASTRVSNELGAGNPERARSVVRVVMTIAVITAIIVSVALFALRRCLGYAYSNEKEVVDYVVDMVPVLCIQVFMDNLQGTLSGVVRGCGWQHIGAFVNLTAYYLIGIS